MTADPDHELLAAFRRRRDEASFRRLYRCNTPRLYGLALRLTGGSAPEAEELVQEAWVRAIERLDRFRGGSSFRTWVSGIVVNCYRELTRRRARAPERLEPDRAEASTATFPPPPSRAEPIDVERALARLPEGYRAVVVLHDLAGHTHREIAALLAIEEGTSKSQLARGRARLRDLLRGGPDPPTSRDERRGQP